MTQELAVCNHRTIEEQLGDRAAFEEPHIYLKMYSLFPLLEKLLVVLPALEALVIDLFQRKCPAVLHNKVVKE